MSSQFIGTYHPLNQSGVAWTRVTVESEKTTGGLTIVCTPDAAKPNPVIFSGISGLPFESSRPIVQFISTDGGMAFVYLSQCGPYLTVTYLSYDDQEPTATGVWLGMSNAGTLPTGGKRGKRPMKNSSKGSRVK